jgi:peptidoglycan hydrolase CwlO-like protein
MKKAPLILGLTAVLSSCAVLSGVGEPDAEAELDRGLTALRAREYDDARRILEPVYQSSWQQPVGQEALLALAAMELDPRNPERRLWAGADLAGRLLSIPQASAADVPVAETLYLLAVELGAAEERIARADSVTQAAEDRSRRPTSSVLSVPARMAKLQSERDGLSRRNEQLQATLKTRDKELADAKQELERIKKTLKIQ